MEPTLIQSVREVALIDLLKNGTVSIRTDGDMRIVEVDYHTRDGSDANALFMILASMAEEA